MEEIDFLDFSDIVIPPVTFYAKFDPLSGRVLSVGPKSAFFNEKHIMPIDEDIARKIISGEMSLRSCVVNIAEGDLEIAEVKALHKIDDVLHRIPEDKFAEYDTVDVAVVYLKENNSLVFELSEEHQGTRKSKVEGKKRKVTWSGETLFNFYITDYNDPNVLYQRVEFKLTDIVGKTLEVDLVSEIPDKFSVYTRRLFKNYILEKK
jgi:hypothetical protein